MEDLISPKYKMELVWKVEKAIWDKYSSYKNVRYYIEKWHVVGDQWNWENFQIMTDETRGIIDLTSTLHTIDGETLLKIAIDIGVETPDFIPSIPTFKNELKSDYKTASATFEKAFKQIESHPDTAIGLANSALESIVKEILKDDRINGKIKGKETLYDLTCAILKEFQLFPGSDMPMEIRTIGSSLIAINQSIEKLRSEKTDFHGKTKDDYVIEDSLYAYFIINTVSTVGLLLISLFKNKYPKEDDSASIFASDDLPF